MRVSGNALPRTSAQCPPPATTLLSAYAAAPSRADLTVPLFASYP